MEVHKCLKWSPHWNNIGFRDVTVKDNLESEVSVTVSLLQIIVLLHFNDDGIFHEIYFININLHLVTLPVDILALTDPSSTMIIYNWNTSKCIHLDIACTDCLQII
ncbi:uncharacterized protein BT62DRAFT_924642 [Guyanagaster necrorhizus]|uniref:Uncharacterized protein n=1 Tax=Guyanagaster necrorhizus TaxID=856835 RepID=A0A9P7VFD8_9AGAR|nr:uncharacterized protein BT62DRAFT_924639 [Guyanagaster necrorhizus MCA 3950]XP_043033070.1 uncharacterized protein BT62DRAFT_924642 [Guyanagaster necrorhizus MCA 3950]KAG7439562.1 hypothetical protein BT62DRAFT_924639 [Guyanagaster necrorhizus MCA 3950]KAG7439570.1 hypothetical protein BT62DRAFT_924642 [Guyanagaster necrorhizus MCA 3950]